MSFRRLLRLCHNKFCTARPDVNTSLRTHFSAPAHPPASSGWVRILHESANCWIRRLGRCGDPGLRAREVQPAAAQCQAPRMQLVQFEKMQAVKVARNSPTTSAKYESFSG